MAVVLHYYDGFGRAEAIRMILRNLRIEFTDNRYNDESFAAFEAKKISETGSVPCLEIDGKALIETRAIERYLLERAGISPATPHEVYLNESTLSILNDVIFDIMKYLYILQDPVAFENWSKNDICNYLKLFNNRVNEHNLFVSDKPQHADWALFEFIWDFFLRPNVVESKRQLLVDNAPKVLAFAENFKNSHEIISQYLDTRPECQY